MTDIKQRFTKPIISKPSSGEWCVFFRFFNEDTAKWHIIKRSEGLNRIKDPKEKLSDFNALLEVRTEWLQAGWNPVSDPDFHNRPNREIEELKFMTFCEALDFAYKKKEPDWKHKSRISFSSVVTHLKKGAVYTGILHQPLVNLKRPHYLDLLERIRFTNQLSGSGFNKYRCYLHGLIDKLLEYDVLEYNPVAKVQKKKVVKTKAHRPPTKDQQLLIVAAAKKKSIAYYRYLCVLYGCSIRPNEACHLRIKDLHKHEQIFRLVPEKGSEENAKAGARDAVIPDWLMLLLSELNLHAYPPDWYIFSSDRKRGVFLPGPKKMHANTTCDWWRIVVKEGLGIDVDQYGLKKLAGDDMIRLKRREGTDNLTAIAQKQMGHSDVRTTKIYTQEEDEINRELIKRKMPVL